MSPDNTMISPNVLHIQEEIMNCGLSLDDMENLLIALRKNRSNKLSFEQIIDMLKLSATGEITRTEALYRLANTDYTN